MLTIESFTVDCVECGKSHKIDASDIPCPIAYRDMERKLDAMTAERDRLAEQLYDIREAVRKTADPVLADIERLRLLEGLPPATPQA